MRHNLSTSCKPVLDARTVDSFPCASNQRLAPPSPRFFHSRMSNPTAPHLESRLLIGQPAFHSPLSKSNKVLINQNCLHLNTRIARPKWVTVAQERLFFFEAGTRASATFNSVKIQLRGKGTLSTRGILAYTCPGLSHLTAKTPKHWV